MKKLNHILVAIDYSENSKNALREASRIANKSNGRLICLHVIDEDIAEVFRSKNKLDEPGVIEVATNNLEAFVGDTIGSGHDVEWRVAIGYPFKEIVDTLNSTGANLLVLGSHGLSSDSPNKVGTLAKRCVRKAPSDVLLVRERQEDPFRCILACVDFSENSIKAAYDAAQLAVQDKATLELLHIFPTPPNLYPDALGFGSVLPRIETSEILAGIRKRLESLADEISAATDACEIRATVEECGSINIGIEQRIKETGADLVVSGTRGRTGLKSLLLGTNAENIIHNSSCSTLSVKPEGFHYEVS
jgi:universal stress protein E